jgi:DNA-binding NarL/FixJ family response regulator
MRGAAPAAGESEPHLVVDRLFLEDLKELTVGDFVEMVASLNVPRARHLHSLPASPNVTQMRALLSARELQVVRLLSEGLTNMQISRRLGLSDKTVKNHISHVLAKLKLSARTQIAIHALRAGIV